MDVNFKRENGFCPYFIYKNTRYYIQDRKNRIGDYVYTLMSVNTDVETLLFPNKDAALDYIKGIKGIRYFGSTSDKEAYSNRIRLYIIQGSTVTVRHEPDILSGEFESYEQCLDFAKTFISEKLGLSSEQLSFL